MMRNITIVRLMVAAFILGMTQTAAAYIGPGAGLSLVGALWGLLVAVCAAVAFIVMWPLRKAFARRSRNRQPATDNAQQQQHAPAAERTHTEGTPPSDDRR